MIKRKITLFNTLSLLLLQFATIASGFIIPKIILTYFGSETNGLVSSINQFLNYIALIEGGVTGVVAASLYKPLVSGDNRKISSIIKTAQRFYKKISYIFIIYALILAISYPVFFETNYSFIFVSSLVLILAISLMIQYMFSLTTKTLLNADKKIYVVSFTQSAIHIIGIILAFVSVKFYPEIHLLKFLTGILFVLQPIVFKIYTSKHYKIDKNEQEDKTLLSKRWDGFAINIAAFIHNSTDIVILTVFTNLSLVSVYSIHLLITTGIKNIINAIISSLNPTLGHSYAKKDTHELNNKMDIYEYIVFLLVSFSFSLAAMLITPFVMIYTNGVTDAQYYQPIFAILLLLSEALYIIKSPHLNLAYAANKFKEIAPSGFIEAGINIALSLILVQFLGLIGVAIGTLVAMIYRMIYHVWYTTKIIKGRKQLGFYKKLIVFSVTSIIGIFLSSLLIPKIEYSIISWIWHALVYGFIIAAMLLATSVIFYKKELKFIKRYLSKANR